MKLILPLIALSAALVAMYYINQPTVDIKGDLDLDAQFFNFIAEHGKQYKTAAEVKIRFEQFKKNLGEIKRIIESQELGFDIAVNYMADWTDEEYQSRLTYRSRGVSKSKTISLKNPQLGQIVYDHIDWTQKKKVSRVKDQGSCGSCWAFSAVGALESTYAIEAAEEEDGDKKIPNFSEQQIVDCSHEFGSEACEGGWMEGAMEHWKSHPALLEKEYPYTGVEGTCKEDSIAKTSQTPVKKISEYYFLEKDSTGENSMAAIQDQPLSVAIDASSISFQFYSKGVVDKCKNNGLNHGVTLVGYGAESGKEYFLIKNSWGSRWGDKGYIKLAVSGQNCGVNEEPLVLVL